MNESSLLDSTGVLDNALSTAVDATKEDVKILSGFIDIISEKFKSFLPSLMFAIIIFIIGLALSKLVLKIVSRTMKKTNTDLTAQSFLKSLIRIILYVFLIVITLSILNVPMSSIVATIGAAGLAIGLALQNSLGNIAGGFIILFSKPFKVGDFIESDSASGTVEGIDILYTKLVTADNKTIHIPNGNVANAKIVNYTAKDFRRLDLEFTISYNNDAEKATKIIEDIIETHPLAEKEPLPFVRMGRHGDCAITIFARIWVATDKYWELNFDMLERVKSDFDKNNIEIPFPQLDVHMDN